MKDNTSKRYVALCNVFVSVIPSCTQSIIVKDSIVRLHKHVKNKYIVRCYHCSQLYQDFLVSESQFERSFKKMQRAETMLDLQQEFRTNIETANAF